MEVCYIDLTQHNLIRNNTKSTLWIHLENSNIFWDNRVSTSYAVDLKQFCSNE